MGNDSLENISGLQSLEAENKHLKSMLNRFVSAENGRGTNVSLEINKKISDIIDGAKNYEEAVELCLQQIGEIYAVDRVSLFSYIESAELYSAMKQWTNDLVQEYHPADLTISAAENPLSCPNVGCSFASSHLSNDLPQSLAEKFEIFSVQSLLIFPVSVAHIKNGLLVIELCSFKREWYEFEIKEIEQVVSLMTARLDVLWHKNSASRLWNLNLLKKQILQKIKVSKRTVKSINEALKVIGEELNLRSIYIVDKESFTNGHELAWAYSQEHEEELLSNQDLAKLSLNSEDLDARYFCRESLKVKEIDAKPETNFILTCPVIIQKEFGGWLIGEFEGYETYSPKEMIQFWGTIALTLSEIVSAAHHEKKYKEKFVELLNQNKQASQKEIFANAVMNNAPFGMLTIEEGKISSVNQFVYEFTGYSQDELIGSKPEHFLYEKSEEAIASLQNFFANIKETGQADVESIGSIKNGEPKRISLYGTIGINPNQFLVFVRDITESYQAQIRIKESKERYQKIAEAAINGVLVLDNNHQIQFLNQSACKIFGQAYDQMFTLSKTDLIHSDSLSEFEHALYLIQEGQPYSGDLKVLNSAGKTIEIELSGTQIKMDNQYFAYLMLHDISERKRNEKAIKESEREFRSLTQNSPDIILRLNEQGEVLFYNQAFTDQFNFLNPDSIIGKSLYSLQVLDELVHQTWQTKINDTFLIGEKVSMELGFSDEKNELYFDWTISPEKNSAGNTETVLAIGRNLTPRKTTEKHLMLAKEKAEESDRLKSEFLANISHELRTPLNAIVGFSSLLRGSQIPSGEVDEYVDVIHKNSDSLMSLINNIIDVAKIESGKISVVKERLNLDELMQSLYNDFIPKVEVEHKGRVKIYYSKLESSELIIMTDPIRLRQVLVNLIGNAIKFTIKGFIEFGVSKEGGELRFFVKDTGIGISEAKQKIIFQPFRKGEEETDKLYRGTGIGLAICDKLVSALGGHIGLLSEKGQGSEFYFTHPIDDRETKNIILDEPKTFTFSNPVLPKNFYWPNKLMLLVDENSSAHLQMRKYIEKTGITLVSARTAAGASKLLMNRKDIHLVLMDMNFPDSDGYKLVQIIKGLNKNLPVIAHSATAVNGEREKLIKGGFDACIAKPAEKEELLSLMDQFLVKV